MTIGINDVPVTVQRMYKFETERPLKAFVDVVIADVILLKGVRVTEENGKLRVEMPREQSADKKWYDTVRCLTPEIRDKIEATVLKAYNEE